MNQIDINIKTEYASSSSHIIPKVQHIHLIPGEKIKKGEYLLDVYHVYLPRFDPSKATAPSFEKI